MTMPIVRSGIAALPEIGADTYLSIQIDAAGGRQEQAPAPPDSQRAALQERGYCGGDRREHDVLLGEDSRRRRSRRKGFA